MRMGGWNDFKTKNAKRLIAGTGFHLPNDRISYLLDIYPAIDKIEQCDAYTFLNSKFDISNLEWSLEKKSISILDIL